MSLPSCKADRKTLATNKFVQFRNHLYILQLNVNFSFRPQSRRAGTFVGGSVRLCQPWLQCHRRTPTALLSHGKHFPPRSPALTMRAWQGHPPQGQTWYTRQVLPRSAIKTEGNPQNQRSCHHGIPAELLRAVAFLASFLS